MLAMARVVRPVTGRAVVLTYDKTSMFKVSLNFINYKLIIYCIKISNQYKDLCRLQSIGKFNEFWKLGRQSYANIGGLAALVYCFSRTDKMPSNPSDGCEDK